jgi:hypothetical protein
VKTHKNSCEIIDEIIKLSMKKILFVFNLGIADGAEIVA